MLLAAGLGTRLRPLTLKVPKPLLPLDGITLIDHQLFYLAKHGITHVVINLHHLGDMIRNHIGSGSRYNLKVHFSDEPAILGTGGGVKKVGNFFDKKPFFVLNSDTLIELNLEKVADNHLLSKRAATMVLKRIDDGDIFTPVSINDMGFVDGFGSGNHLFTGLQILGPEMLDILPPEGEPACLVRDGYKRLLEKDIEISAFIHDGYWNDLGTIERYEQAKGDIKSGRFNIITE